LCSSNTQYVVHSVYMCPKRQGKCFRCLSVNHTVAECPTKLVKVPRSICPACYGPLHSPGLEGTCESNAKDQLLPYLFSKIRERSMGFPEFANEKSAMEFLLGEDGTSNFPRCCSMLSEFQ
jgi:hypothetical protein